jgi:hypothetical protein
MVAVDSPYSVLPKSFPQGFGDAAPYLAPASCFARAAVRTGESSDDLKSWLLERLTYSSTGWVHLCDRLRVRDEELRRTLFRPHLQWSSCVIPVGLRPSTRRFCASSVPAHRPTLRFSRDILVPTTGVCESCSLSGASPSIGSCAPRPEQLQVYRSVNFCASSSGSVTWRTFPLESSAIHHPTCLKNSPPESRWATSPPRKMALGPLQASHWPPKCPLRSGPAGCASLIEVFNTAGRSPPSSA